MGDYFYPYIWVDHTDGTNRKIVAQCERPEDVEKYKEKYKDNDNVKMYELIDKEGE